MKTMKPRLAAAWMAAWAAGVASAQTTNFWTNTAGGLWSVGGNWTLGVPSLGGASNYVLDFQTPTTTYAATNDLDDTFGIFTLNVLRMGGGVVSLAGNALKFVDNGSITPMISNSVANVETIGNAIELGANATIVNRWTTGTIVVNGAISGTGSLTNMGGGTIIITGNNSYSGETVARTSGNQAWTGLILSNTTGGVSVPGNLKIGAVSGNAYVRLGANEQIADTASIEFIGANYGRFMLLGRTETVAGIQSSTAGAGMIENTDINDLGDFGAATLILNPASGDTYNFSGYLRSLYSGTPTSANFLNIVKKGDGTQILAGANIGVNDLGGVRIEGGTLVLTNTTSSKFSAPIDITGSGKLVLEHIFDASRNPVTNNVAGGLSFGLTNVFAIGGLSGAGSIALTNRAGQAVTLAIGSNDTSGVYSGDLSGPGGLIKAGTGTQVLSGNNTYAGTTLLTNGVLSVTKAAALPGYASAGMVTIAGGLVLNAGGSGWTEGQINTLLANAAFTTGSRLELDVAGGATLV